MKYAVKAVLFTAILLISAAVRAQEKPMVPVVPIIVPTTTASLSEAQRIPLNSKVYIAPMDGFESYMAAALRAKHVPLLMVTDRDQADFEITGAAETKHASWAKIFVMGDLRNTETASFTVTNLKTKVVVWADTSDRGSAWHGKKSTAEKLAKFLGEKMKDDQKK